MFLYQILHPSSNKSRIKLIIWYDIHNVLDVVTLNLQVIFCVQFVFRFKFFLIHQNTSDSNISIKIFENLFILNQKCSDFIEKFLLIFFFVNIFYFYNKHCMYLILYYICKVFRWIRITSIYYLYTVLLDKTNSYPNVVNNFNWHSKIMYFEQFLFIVFRFSTYFY